MCCCCSVFNKPLMKLCPKHSTTCVNWDIVQVRRIPLAYHLLSFEPLVF
jgi:hypothetical protein